MLAKAAQAFTQAQHAFSCFNNTVYCDQSKTTAVQQYYMTAASSHCNCTLHYTKNNNVMCRKCEPVYSFSLHEYFPVYMHTIHYSRLKSVFCYRPGNSMYTEMF